MNKLFILLALILSSFTLHQPAATPAFQGGEMLKYRIHYGLLDAGVAELHVKETNYKGKPVLHAIGTGKSVGMTEWFFKVRDRYETKIDPTTMYPVHFVRDVNEGGFIIKRDIEFDQHAHVAVDRHPDPDKVVNTGMQVHDLLSMFYYARSRDVSWMKPGDEMEIVLFMDHELFRFKLRFLGKETLKTEVGHIPCLKFRPIVQKGRVFKEEESMHLWVSNDANKIPVRIQTDLLIGSLRADLTEYRGLVAPLNKK
jgi:hypothetical protein